MYVLYIQLNIDNYGHSLNDFVVLEIVGPKFKDQSFLPPDGSVIETDLICQWLAKAWQNTKNKRLHTVRQVSGLPLTPFYITYIRLLQHVRLNHKSSKSYSYYIKCKL